MEPTQSEVTHVICTVEVNGYFNRVDPAVCKLLEYTEDELLYLPLLTLVHPDEQLSMTSDLATLSEITTLLHIESRCVTKSGRIKWLAWTFIPNSDGGLIETIIKDLTQKKELEYLLQTAANLASIGVWEYDIIMNTVYWSDITKRMHEVPQDYEPDLENALGFYKGPEEIRFIRDSIYQAINTCASFDAEIEIITAKGNAKCIRVLAVPEFVAATCIKLRGVFQDIDVRKKSQMAVEDLLKERNTILESIGDAFFAVDNNWTVTYWNRKAERVLGKLKADMVGNFLWDIFSDSINSNSYTSYHSALRENRVIHFEDYYAPLEKWYGISAYPSEIGLSVYFKDITQKKAGELRLIDSERRYSELFQLSPLPNWVFDMVTLEFLDVNQAAVDHYGYSREEFLSMTIKDIRPLEDLVNLDKSLELKKSDARFVNRGVFTHRKKSGKLIKVEIQSNPITYQGMDAKIIIAHDITENLSYIKEVEMQNEKLRDISWMQSHLVRAPLARIIALAKLITVDDEKPGDNQQIIEYLLLSANELDKVITKITSKSKT